MSIRSVLNRQVFSTIMLFLMVTSLALGTGHAGLPYGPYQEVMGLALFLNIDVNNTIVGYKFLYQDNLVLVLMNRSTGQYSLHLIQYTGGHTVVALPDDIGLVNYIDNSPDGSVMIIDGFDKNLVRKTWVINIDTQDVSVLNLSMPGLQETGVSPDWNNNRLLVVQTNYTNTIVSSYSISDLAKIWSLDLGPSIGVRAFTCQDNYLIILENETDSIIYRIGENGTILDEKNISIRGKTVPLGDCSKLAVYVTNSGLYLVDLGSGDLTFVSGVSGYLEDLFPSPQSDYIAVLVSEYFMGGNKTIYVVSSNGNVVFSNTYPRIEKISWSPSGILGFLAGNTTFYSDRLVLVDTSSNTSTIIGPFTGPVTAYGWYEDSLYMAYSSGYASPTYIRVYNSSMDIVVDQSIGLPLRLDSLLITSVEGQQVIYYVGTYYDMDTDSIHSLAMGYVLREGMVISWTPVKEIVAIPDKNHEIVTISDTKSTDGLNLSYTLTYSHGTTITYTSGTGDEYYQTFINGVVVAIYATATGSGEAQIILTSPMALEAIILDQGNTSGAQVVVDNETHVRIILSPDSGTASIEDTVIAFKYPVDQPLPDMELLNYTISLEPSVETGSGQTTTTSQSTGSGLEITGTNEGKSETSSPAAAIEQPAESQSSETTNITGEQGSSSIMKILAIVVIIAIIIIAIRFLKK
ncbi:MAG: hypothetical protein GSR72_06685 [Desulfurococcales archaeon]|nr:hypothetical protein [Desulfurococcales archaeon]